MKLKEIRMQRGIQQKELARQIGVDEPTLSKFENGKFLPTPGTMERILRALDCRIKDVYAKKEITFIDVKKTEENPSKATPSCYKVTVRMPAARKEDLQVAIKGCGYSSLTAWFSHCAERLWAEYEERQKQKETSSTADQSTDEVIVKETGDASSTLLYHKDGAMSRGEVNFHGEKDQRI